MGSFVLQQLTTDIKPRSGQALMSRALGRPGQAKERKSPGGVGRGAHRTTFVCLSLTSYVFHLNFSGYKNIQVYLNIQLVRGEVTY